MSEVSSHAKVERGRKIGSQTQSRHETRKEPNTVTRGAADPTVSFHPRFVRDSTVTSTVAIIELRLVQRHGSVTRNSAAPPCLCLLHHDTKWAVDAYEIKCCVCHCDKTELVEADYVENKTRRTHEIGGKQEKTKTQKENIKKEQEPQGQGHKEQRKNANKKGGMGKKRLGRKTSMRSMRSNETR